MGGRGSGSGFKAGGNNPAAMRAGSGSTTIGLGASTQSASESYFDQIGVNPRNIKAAQHRSQMKGDGVFLTMPQIRQAIANAVTPGMSPQMINDFKYRSVPDRRTGEVDVEVEYGGSGGTSPTAWGVRSTRSVRRDGAYIKKQKKVVRVKIMNP